MKSVSRLVLGTLLAFTAACSGGGGASGGDDVAQDTVGGEVQTCQKPEDCDDGNACSKEECLEGLCVWTDLLEGACDDGKLCTEGDSCVAGVCQGLLKQCDDGQPCNGLESCDTKTGECVVKFPVVLDDGVACTVDECDPESGTLSHSPDHAACDDDNACTEDLCDLLEGCAQTPLSEVTCDDLNLCTTEDLCTEGFCAGTPVVCEDGLFCNGVATCSAEDGECLPGTPPATDDGISCTLDSCDEEQDLVVNEPDHGLCDDLNQCTEDSCGLTGCENPDREGTCDDDDACTQGDLCEAGQCLSGLFVCVEDCLLEGDEDRDGAADCADEDCALTWICMPSLGTCANPHALPLAEEAGALGQTLVFTGESATAQHLRTSSCGPEGTPQVVHGFTLAVPTGLEIRLLEGAAGAALSLLAEDCATELACGPLTLGGQAFKAVLLAGTYFLVLEDGAAEGSNPYRISVTAYAPDAEETRCLDGLDDDADGLTDCDDESCKYLDLCRRGEDCQGAFYLRVPPISHADAGLKIELNANQLDTHYSTVGFANDLAGSCAAATGASPDAVYRFELAQPMKVKARLDFAQSAYPAVYVLGEACGAGPERGCASASSGPALLYTALPAGVWYLVVDGAWAGDQETYSLSVEFSIPPGLESDCSDFVDEDVDGLTDCEDSDCAATVACLGMPGDRCSSPLRPLNHPITTADFGAEIALAGDSSVGMNDDFSAACAGGSGGSADVVYHLEVQDPVLVDFGFTFTKSGFVLYPAVYLLDGTCRNAEGPATCYSGKNNALSGRLYLPAGTWHVVVDGNYVALGGGGDAGPFTLALKLLAPEAAETLCLNGLDDDLDGTVDCHDGDCAANLLCRDPYEKNDSFATAAELGNLTDETVESSDPSIYPAGDKDYLAFQIGAYQRLDLELVPALTLDLRFELLRADGSLVKAVDAGKVGAPEVLLEYGLAAGNYVLLVAPYSQGTEGYTLSLTLGSIPMTELSCTDGLDEDLDLAADCCDEDCAGDPACLAEGVCGDGLDNDCDQAGDCADSDCAEAAFCGNGDGCAEAVALGAGGFGADGKAVHLVEYGNTTGFKDDFSLGCAAASTGSPDGVWSLNLAERMLATVAMDYLADAWPSVGLGGGNCGSTGVLKACAKAMSGAAATKKVLLEAGTWWIYADGAFVGERGPYRLEVWLDPIPVEETACGDGKDEDWDGLTDCCDTDCQADELCQENCEDRLDNDCDQQLDCCDEDCSEALFCAVEKSCGDGLDNDCNGNTDCLDEGCFGDLGECQGETCSTALQTGAMDPVVLPARFEFFGDTSGMGAEQTMACIPGSAEAADAVYRLELTEEATLDLELLADESLNLGLAVMPEDCSQPMVACGLAQEGKLTLTKVILGAGVYHFVIDGAGLNQDGAYALTLDLKVHVVEQNCSDGLDGDGDELIDCCDDDCVGEPECVEICGDNRDGDCDGKRDCFEEECLALLDCSDSDEDGVPNVEDQCPLGHDGVDLDGDDLPDACEIVFAGNAQPLSGSRLDEDVSLKVSLEVGLTGVTNFSGQGPGLTVTAKYRTGGAKPWEPLAMTYDGDSGSADRYLATIPEAAYSGGEKLELTYSASYSPGPGKLAYLYNNDPITDAGSPPVAVPLAYQVSQSAARPGPGEIMISEIHFHPKAVDDSVGEWFEVINLSARDLELEGLTISNGTGDSFRVSHFATLPIGGVQVFGAEGDGFASGGIIPDLVYDDVPLGNNGETLTLHRWDLVVDEVHWTPGVGGWPVVDGASMVLDLAVASDVQGNDLASNWCVSRSAFGAGDLGTPAGPNDPCSEVECDNLTDDDDDGKADCADADCQGLDGCGELLCLDDLDNDDDGEADCLDADCLGEPLCGDDDSDGTLNRDDLCPQGDDSEDADDNGLPDPCEVDSVAAFSPPGGTNLDKAYDVLVLVQVDMAGVTEVSGEAAELLVTLKYRRVGDPVVRSTLMQYDADLGGADEYIGVIPWQYLRNGSQLQLEMEVEYLAGVPGVDYIYAGPVSDALGGLSPFLFTLSGTSPASDDSNWGFEEEHDLGWDPLDFQLMGGAITAEKDTVQAAAGTASCKLTWTSTENQDIWQSAYSAVEPGKQAAFSLKALDNDASGWARPFLQFYGPTKAAVGGVVFGSAYSADGAAWQVLSHSATVPVGASFVRAGVRFSDIVGSWDGQATINLDSWAVQVQ